MGTRRVWRGAAGWVLLAAAAARAQAPGEAPPGPGTGPNEAEAAPASASGPAERSRAVFVEAWEVVRDHFYDPALGGVDWEGVRREFEPLAAEARGRAAVSRVINSALERLHASHTRHYTPDQREYYELLDVFYPEGVPERVAPGVDHAPPAYIGVGLVSREIGGRVFVADVYPGGPADAAGLRVGDELVGVEGTGGPLGVLNTVRRAWSDVSPFRGRAGVPTRVLVRRSEGAAEEAVVVTPRKIQPHRAFLEALKKSAAVIERGGRRIGYIRVRSYAHPSYQEAVVHLIQTKFARCDGLVLDLRGGWGGAKPEYLDAFNPAGVGMTWRGRGEEWTAGNSVWTGPMVVLIDSGTRSGKEVLSLGFKSRPRTRLVGEATAGAVLGGRPFVLSDESLLLVAVSDVRSNGVRLEGAGVEPDVRAERPIPFCGGADPVLEAGLIEMEGLLRGGRAP